MGIIRNRKVYIDKGKVESIIVYTIDGKTLDTDDFSSISEFVDALLEVEPDAVTTLGNFRKDLRERKFRNMEELSTFLLGHSVQGAKIDRGLSGKFEYNHETSFFSISKDATYFMANGDVLDVTLFQPGTFFDDAYFEVKYDLEEKEDELTENQIKVGYAIISALAILAFCGLMYLIGIKAFYGARSLVNTTPDDMEMVKQTFKEARGPAYILMLILPVRFILDSNIFVKKIKNIKTREIARFLIDCIYPVLFFIGIRIYALAMDKAGYVPLLLKPIRSTKFFVIILIITFGLMFRNFWERYKEIED